MWPGAMASSIQMPMQLASLLSCCLCHRPYALEGRILPKELDCQHSVCEECLDRIIIRESMECLCPLCGFRTILRGRKLPETMAIMFLLRELPALVLGRAMLDFTKESSSSSIEVVGRQRASSPVNWLDQVCVTSFLASSSEYCPVHAMPNSTWCHNCQLLLCRACADAPKHREHRLIRQLDYLELLRQLLCAELAKIKCAAAEASLLAARDVNLLRQLVEACYLVHLHVKRQMGEHKPSMVSNQMTGWSVRAEHELNSSASLHSGTELRNLLSRLVIQRRKCESQLVEVHFQCRMRAAVQENGMQILDFETLNDRLLRLRSNPRPGGIPASVEPPQALVLTNYCVFSYWNELRSRLIPSADQDWELQAARHFALGKEREGSVNSATSPGSNGSSYAAFPQQNQLFHRMSSVPEFRFPSQSPTQQQRQQLEMNLLLAHEGLRQQQQQQQRLAAFWQDDPNWSQELRPMRVPGAQDDESNLLVSMARPPSLHCYPIYYLDLDIAGELAGRVLVEVRDDAAPRMSDNFGALIRHDRGYGYRGCSIFQAWGGESIISGDFESNSGRGGHSAFDTRYFMPDNTGLPAHRGTVGMRRGQRRQDRSGLVGSQFRLVLNEMRSFTAIFGYIVEGIEVADRIAATGNAIGRLAVKCIIRDCGEYHMNR